MPKKKKSKIKKLTDEEYEAYISALRCASVPEQRPKTGIS